MNASAFSAKKRKAAERVEQEAKAAQKRRDEAKPVEMFETKDYEFAAQLTAVYRPQFVRSKLAQDANGRSSSRSKIPSVADQVLPQRWRPNARN